MMTIAFQGAKGAYSDLACRQMYPEAETLPSSSFAEAFEAVVNGTADKAVIPIDNTLAGRVADVHHLLPQSGLYIVGEHFLPIHHCLLGVKGAKLSDITHVHSHVHALPQCRQFIKDHGLQGVVHADTAGAARDIAMGADKTQAAVASALAAAEYGLDILAQNIEDDARNKTRFIALSKTALPIDRLSGDVITAFTFKVRDIPAALYKALGGFATNQVNMLKLESYVDHDFRAARFYAEIDGCPGYESVDLALDELNHFSDDVQILGTFPKSPLRDAF